MPPRLVFGLAETASVVLLVSAPRKDSIQSLGDLVGQTIGVPAPGTPADFMLLAILSNAGIPLGRVKVKSYGERGLAGALDSGELTAGIIGEPYASRLIEDGKAVALVDLRKREGRDRWLGEPAIYSALFARVDSQLQPSALRSLDRALLRALARIETASPEELRARLPAAALGLPEDWDARLSAARQIFVKDGLVTTDMLRRGIHLIREHGPIPTRVKMPRSLGSLLMIGPLEEVLEARRR